MVLMNKALLILAILAVLIVPSVNAAATYEPNSDVIANIQCMVTNYTSNVTSYCTDGNTECNVSAYWPNASAIVENGSMSQINPSAMIYSYDFGNLSAIGSYTVVTYCYDDSVSLGGTSAFVFKIANTTNTIVTNIFSFLFVIIAIILFIIGIIRQDWVFIVLSGFMFIIQGFYTYYNPIAYLSNVMNLALSFVLWGIGAYLLVRTTIEAVNIG